MIGKRGVEEEARGLLDFSECHSLARLHGYLTLDNGSQSCKLDLNA